MALLIADSGPLIALSRLDLLWLPARLQREVLVPGVVWTEVTRAAPGNELALLESALASGNVLIVPDDRPLDPRLDNVTLDEGELSALDLALHHGAAVLVDELRGRAVASRLGLQVVGTLGLLLLARERGLVGALRPLVEVLQSGGYFLSRRLVEQVVAEDESP